MFVSGEIKDKDDRAVTQNSEARKHLLERRLRGELGRRPSTPVISPRTPGEPIPLSYAQEQVWLHAQLAGDFPLYNEPVTIHYSGALNVAALEKSFNEILRRHEAWRTFFSVVDGQPTQEVVPNFSISLPVLDLRDLPQAERNTAALAIATEDARRPIDLGRVPLFGARLIRLDNEEYRLYLTLSHIIFDGVGFYRVFLPELAALYKAFGAGKPSPLPEPVIQYPDFACWQRQTMTTEALAKDIEFWGKQLSRNLPDSYLPVDRTQKRALTFRGSMYPFRLSKSLTAKLGAFCRTEDVSLFHVLFAAFAALLYRYSGEEVIPIGSITAGRDRPETEALLGYFLNTVVFPCDVSGNPSFRTLVQRFRNLTIDVLEHDRLPFEHLVKELKVRRNPGRNPLFQAMFSLDPPLPEIDPAWRLTQMDVDTGASKYDLYLELGERRAEVLARFHYSTDLFGSAMIAALANHWQRLLEGAIDGPEQTLSQLPVLTAEENNQIVTEWNRTDGSYPQACIHELFELQVDRSPDAVAVVFEDSQLCYGELNERANQLAWYLRQQGVGRDVPVGICVDRGLEMVVGLLGILKAGGAYVPLDPRLPQGRLTFMLSDVNPPVVLTQQRWQDKFPGARKVLLDRDGERIARESTANPGKGGDPHTLAYVMYTSGSTGRPKGVPIEHRSVVNFLCSMQRDPGLSEEDVLLAVTTLSFDIAGLEIYLPLISGARLVVAGLETAVDGARLLELLLENKATILQATPVTWRLLIEAGWQGSGDFKILCGGEALSPELAVELVKRSGSVWNMYGPTETTIWSSLRRVTGQEENGIPIGRPIANTQIYILDSHLNPVPANIVGEIYIGGDGVARGYLNRAELTAERFVANPLTPSPSARLYKTGDLGRFRSDGNIEYLGRVDDQVKIRGVRIELGEIEAALVGHSGVREAVVAALEDVTGEKRLVAYYTASDPNGPTIEARELRAHLSSQLPDYMVPAAYVRMYRMPLTANGKLDSKALPMPEGDAHAVRGYEAPKGEIEQRLVEIWADVLKVERVGREDNFFELGGHSLLAMRVMARVRHTFDLELPVRCLFDEPTIAALADEVQRAQALGLKGRSLIARRRAGSVLPASSREALLSQLDKLSPDEAQTLLKSVLHEKHSA
jgi:surfactin family lipopeptide synthetase A